MTDETQTVEADDFDAAYEEFTGSDDQTSGEPEDVAEPVEAEAETTQTDEITPETQDSDDAGNATEAESAASAPDQPERKSEEVEKLEQKLKSAEGRLGKFEQSVEEMREELKQYQGKPKPSDTHTTQDNSGNNEFIPPGMDKDDWLDLQEDYPDTAKALKEKFSNEQKVEAENRELKEKQEQEAQLEKDREAFRKTILDVHPDYDTVIAPKVDDLKAFIDEQTSAVQKQQYQRIFDGGSAEEVNALVTDYKANRGLNQSGNSEPQSHKKLDAALAVPSKGGGNPNLNKGKVNMDDFDAAYEEALQSDTD